MGKKNVKYYLYIIIYLYAIYNYTLLPTITLTKACWYCLFLKAYMNGFIIADPQAKMDAMMWM